MGYSPLFTGAASKAPSRGTQSNYTNATGSTITKGSVLSVNTSGQSVLIDVSDETSALGLLGLAAIATPDGASGGVTSSGRLEDIGSFFSVGSAIYVGTNGQMTDHQPIVGQRGFSEGDFVIFLGVVVQNEFDNTKYDIQLLIQLVGQL